MFRSLKNTLRTVSVLSFIPLVTLITKPNAALAGNFSASCRDIRLQGTASLSAICKNASNRPSDVNGPSLNLSLYISNYNGRLVWSSQGGFKHTCYNSIVVFPATLLSTCKNNNGGQNNVSINLNERISNINGVLKADF
jgi:hypothetical protein